MLQISLLPREDISIFPSHKLNPLNSTTDLRLIEGERICDKTRADIF